MPGDPKGGPQETDGQLSLSEAVLWGNEENCEGRSPGGRQLCPSRLAHVGPTGPLSSPPSLAGEVRLNNL